MVFNGVPRNISDDVWILCTRAWMCILVMIEGSLEVKLPTIWTDEAAEAGRGREEKESEERKSEEKDSVERRSRCAKR